VGAAGRWWVVHACVDAGVGDVHLLWYVVTWVAAVYMVWSALQHVVGIAAC
jgi:hypothetical protein